MFADEKAQISIELILIFAAVVAAVLILVTRLQSTAESGIDKIENTAKDVFDKIDDITEIE